MRAILGSPAPLAECAVNIVVEEFGLKEIITAPNAPVTGFTDVSKPAPIAQAIRAGNLLFVSGQGPLDAERKVVSGDIAMQTKQTLANLRAILEHAGSSFRDVVNMRVCLREVSDFPAFNEAFGQVMAGEKVTRTCIGGTPHRTGVNVEIDCIAYVE